MTDPRPRGDYGNNEYVRSGLNQPARPAAARPASHDAGGQAAPRGGSAPRRCGQSDEDKIGGNRRRASESIIWSQAAGLDLASPTICQWQAVYTSNLK